MLRKYPPNSDPSQSKEDYLKAQAEKIKAEYGEFKNKESAAKVKAVQSAQEKAAEQQRPPIEKRARVVHPETR